MDDVTFKNMSERLIEAVPELKDKYQKEKEWWGDETPGAHNIYGAVLNPYIETLLENKKKEEVLVRIFSFLERLANNKDVKVQEVVSVTVLEYLMNNNQILMAKEYMGDTTLKFLRELYDFWG